MIQSLRIHFTGHNKLQLDARLELPESPRCFAIFSHCFTCTKDTLATFRISKELAKQGIATLRFDFAGLGRSGGDFADTNFSTNKQDLHAAIDFLTQHYQSPALLMGHSLGGTTALACATENENIIGSVTVASPSQPAHVLHHFGDALDELEAGKSSKITVGGSQYTINPQFVDDIQQHNLQQALSNHNKPILIFSVDNDDLVGAHNAQDIHQWSAGESNIITLNATDHIISDKETAINIAEAISAFYSRLTQA